MAQYYEVLSQGDKSTGEVRQFYTNIEDESQTVQYVISPDSHQQFQTQQIVVSSDQLMLVDDQPQQIITYQQPQQQYIIEDNRGIDFQNTQQIFYMEGNNDTVEQVVVNQAQLKEGHTIVQPVIQTTTVQNQGLLQTTHQVVQAQPIVLNHQIGAPATIRTAAAKLSQLQNQGIRIVHTPVRQQTIQQPNRIAQPNTQAAQVRGTTPARMQQVRQPNQMTQQRTMINQQKINQQPALLQNQTNFPQQVVKTSKVSPVEYRSPQIKLDDIKPSDSEEAYALPDGSIVPLSQYKKMLMDQKNQQALQQQQQRMANAATSTTGTPPSPKRARNSNPNRNRNPKTNRGVGGGRGRGNANQFSSPQAPGNAVQQQPQQPRYLVNQQQQHLKQQQMRQQQQQQNQYQVNQNQNQMMQQQQRAQPPQPQQHQAHPQPQQQPQQRQSQANYVIKPPQVNQRQQPQRPLPSFIPSSQIQQIIDNTPISDEFSDSIRMLVLLANGEQRLITFTLPKEACTIQEILEQVNVPFQHDTNIQVTEANTNGINYIVTVGNVNFCYSEEEPSEPDSSTPPPQPQQQQQPASSQAPQTPMEPPKPPSPEPPKEVPRLIPGKLALCANCGYLSEDFNRCMRCKRKLLDNVKAIPSTATINGKKSDVRALVNDKKVALKANGAAGRGSANSSPKKKTAKSKVMEQEQVLVVSSDEEEEEKTPTKLMNEQLLQKLGASVTISPVTKEPTISDIQRNSVAREKVLPVPAIAADKFVKTLIECRTIRIGSYRFVPPERVCVDSKSVLMKVPHPKLENEVKTIKIDRNDIVKVLVSFNKSLPVIFYYLIPSVAAVIRELLDMQKGSDNYFDPLSEQEESHRRITLLPEELCEEDKHIFQQIYSTGPHNIIDELTAKEANDILIKTCPKELTKNTLGLGSIKEIKQLMMYPPEGRGRISINTEDYECLGTDNFLNDVIIDFYLKYLVLNLPKEQQDKVHVFSTFFYKRLTTKPVKASRKSQPSEIDPNLTASQKRHARVKTWTKNVNLFEKDYIIVPINENAHWFLAIICFPAMEGPHTMDNQPYKLEPKSTRKTKKITINTIGGVPVTTVKEKLEKPIMCEEELSDKDEAEGDDSELDSDDSEETPTATPVSTPVSKQPRPPIKQPCILIFDSLAGASRSRVVATLRDYLTCEYKIKMDKERIYNKDVIKGACPKVPQQTNFTDCGLYLLQYVEQFFKDPIKDYYIPISHLKTWFEEMTVTKKREDISILIKSLMKQYGKDLSVLPDVCFPTLNGKLVERELEDEMEDEEEDMFEDIEDAPIDEEESEMEHSENVSEGAISESAPSLELDETKLVNNSPNQSASAGESVVNKNQFVKKTAINLNLLKPDISEFPRQTNRDTLSYLKAKRIVRHKPSDGPDNKKAKSV